MTQNRSIAHPIDNIPRELKELRRWVVFKVGKQGKKLRKLPINAKTFEAAKCNCPKDWSSFKRVRSLLLKGNFPAIAFALEPEDGFVGFDFDNCVNSECDLHEDVASILEELNTYAELSISGNGVRAIVRGRMPGRRSSTRQTPWGDECAMFDGGKFLIFTGNRFEDLPKRIAKVDDLGEIYERFFPTTIDRARCEEQKRASNQVELPDRVSGCLGDILAIKLGDSNDGSHRLFVYACRAIEWSLPKEEFRSLIRFMHGIQPWPETWTDEQIDRRYADAAGRVDVVEGIRSQDLVLDPGAPLRIGEALVRQEFDHPDHRRLLRHQGDYWVFDEGIFKKTSAEAMRDVIYRFCDQRYYESKDEQLPFDPAKDCVTRIEDALRSVTRIPDELIPPCWLKEQDGFDGTGSLVVHANGITDCQTKKTIPLTPSFFATTRLDFPFDPGAGQDALVVQLLKGSYFPDDPDQVELIQMFAGYCLMKRANHDRILYLYGPPRSGKGTICNVLENLVGVGGYHSMRLAELAGRFALEPMVNKRLLTIRDARLNPRDQVEALERLLLLSGGDPVTIDRKNRQALHATLHAKIVIASNDLLRFTDHAQALASRLMVVRFQRSFTGKEDETLRNRVLSQDEMSKTLNWAIAGLELLDEHGGFPVTESGKEILEAFSSQASPIVSFMRDECEFDREFSVPIGTLYLGFENYCLRNGIHDVPTAQQFGVDLRTAWTAVAPEDLRFRKFRPRSKAPKRKECYAGIRICK